MIGVEDDASTGTHAGTNPTAPVSPGIVDVVEVEVLLDVDDDDVDDEEADGFDVVVETVRCDDVRG